MIPLNTDCQRKLCSLCWLVFNRHSVFLNRSPSTYVFVAPLRSIEKNGGIRDRLINLPHGLETVDTRQIEPAFNTVSPL
jgi:hypothetical protein